MEVPELPAKFQESPKTQDNPRQHSYLLAELALLHIWKWPFDRDQETGTDDIAPQQVPRGAEYIDFFGQKSL